MKTIYLDCSMGAAGDMLTAALLELHEHPEAVLDTLNRVFDGKAVLTVRKDQKCGISGSHVTAAMITLTLRSPILPQRVSARHITTIAIPPSPRSGSLSEGSTFPRM